MKLGSKLKWLYPGMKIKRYLIFLPVGLIFVIFGTALFINQSYDYIIRKIAIFALQAYGINVGNAYENVILASVFLIIGFIIIYAAIKKTVYSIVKAVSPQTDSIVDSVYEKRKLVAGPNIVVIGGGTGLSTMLRGLKEYTGNLTAVVTVTDDGGSSGLLRQEMGILPPGDIRNCLVALAGREETMENLLQYRFDEKNFSGHSFGNLMLGALTDITGDFQSAVTKLSDILAIRGKVYPCSLTSVQLKAEFEDGAVIEGETKISAYGKKIKKMSLNRKNVKTSPEVIEAVRNADLIVLGPGSLYTSIIPNLLVEDIKNAVNASSAKKVYVCNVMTQSGETEDFSAFDHYKTVKKYLNGKIDYCILNNKKPDESVINAYRENRQEFVNFAESDFLRENTEVISDDFLNRSDLARHDFDRLAKKIIRLISNDR